MWNKEDSKQPCKDDKPCLYDITGDGNKEAISQAERFVVVVDHKGKLVWGFELQRPNIHVCPYAAISTEHLKIM